MKKVLFASVMIVSLMLTGCHDLYVKPSSKVAKVEASYGIEGFAADEEDVPMPEPVDVSAPVQKSEVQMTAEKKLAEAKAKASSLKKAGMSWNTFDKFFDEVDDAMNAKAYEAASSVIDLLNVELAAASIQIKTNKGVSAFPEFLNVQESLKNTADVVSVESAANSLVELKKIGFLWNKEQDKLKAAAILLERGDVAGANKIAAEVLENSSSAHKQAKRSDSSVNLFPEFLSVQATIKK
mgnify:CR=1 FL=1